MNSPSKDVFLMEEYKALRAEILMKMQHQLNLQQWGILSLVAIYVVALTSDNLHINSEFQLRMWLIWWLPPLVMAFMSGIYFINDYVLVQSSKYIKEIEEYFLDRPGPIGWETNQDDLRPVWIIRNPFVIIVFLLTVLIAIIRTFHFF